MNKNQNVILSLKLPSLNPLFIRVVESNWRISYELETHPFISKYIRDLLCFLTIQNKLCCKYVTVF